jgi:hypothetical protein
MKILYLQGGLGNQMFQWAFLRYLQSKGRTDIRMDGSAPSLHRHTAFDLYRLFPAIAASGLLIPYRKGRTLHLLGEGLKRVFGCSLETEGHGEDHAVIPRGKLWLRGYWQQARLAGRVREELLCDFAFTEPTDERNLELLRRIDASHSVSVHVRGGDYLEPRQRISFGNLCTPEYYRQAIDRIRATVDHPRFFVFSNEPEWARKVLGDGGEMVYVSHNTGMESYRDMQLMSRCRHHIVANSSFSWWGAWLDPRADKQVYAPAKWIHNHGENFTDLILPGDWIRVGQKRPYVTLEVDSPLSDAEMNTLLTQTYADFELIVSSAGGTDRRIKPPDTEPSGLHRITLRPEDIPLFRDRKYLERRLVNDSHSN